MPDPAGGAPRAAGPGRNPARRRLTAYDWWLINLAVDEEITRRSVAYPVPPLVERLRALRPCLQYRMHRQQERELRQHFEAEDALDSPF